MLIGLPISICAPQYPAGAAFDPLSVGTPVCWLDATELTQALNLVSAIVEKAGVSTVVINALQTPGYTASNADYAGAPTFDFQDLVLAQAARISGHGLTTGAFTLVLVGDGDDGYWLAEPGGSTFVNGGGGAGAEIQATSDAGGNLFLGGGPATTASVFIVVFNGASSKIYRSALTPTTGNAGALQDLTGGTLTAGNLASATQGAQQGGSTRHLMLFNGALSQANCEYLLNGFGDESGIAIGA